METKKELSVEKRLGRTLNIYRLINDVELEDLSKQTGISVKTLVDIEQGVIEDLSICYYAMIAEALELTFDVRPLKYTKDGK